MSGYEQRLQADKAEIRRRVVAVGNEVGKAIADAVAALLAGDKETCYAVILGDLPINREIRALNAKCNAFVARHVPSAGHLRFVSSVMQMNVALERIGDYAVTIAREAIQLKSPIPDRITKDLQELTKRSCQVLSDAISAFESGNAEAARATRPRAKSVERTYGQIYRDLTQEGAALPITDAFALLAVFRRVERVSDQAKNISEETLFELTGETKAPKRYKVLFVDRCGDLLSPLAEALARKAFPGSGEYSSAALEPKPRLAPELMSLADRRGVDLGEVSAGKLSQDVTELELFHVIVALEAGVLDNLQTVPYSSAILNWSITIPSDSTADSFDQTANQLAENIQKLMVLMRGEDAP